MLMHRHNILLPTSTFGALQAEALRWQQARRQAASDRMGQDKALARLLPGLFATAMPGPPTPGELRIALTAALRRERRLAAIRHWSYNLSRHLALSLAL